MKFGILGWDHGELDLDGPVFVKIGRELGHETSLFTLDEIECVPRTSGGLDLLFGGEPARDFDALISRAPIRTESALADLDKYDLVSHVPGMGILDPVDVWLAAESKLGMTQRLGEAGLPVPPTRVCPGPAEVRAAWAEWGPMILKPVHNYGGYNTVRILNDIESAMSEIEKLLAEHAPLIAQPYFHAPEGQWRITTVGGRAMMNFMLVPKSADVWIMNYRQGRSNIVHATPPAEVVAMAERAAKVMRVTLAGVDVLCTEDGYKMLEVNTIPGGLWLGGEEMQRRMMTDMYDLAAQSSAAAKSALSSTETQARWYEKWAVD